MAFPWHLFAHALPPSSSRGILGLPAAFRGVYNQRALPLSPWEPGGFSSYEKRGVPLMPRCLMIDISAYPKSLRRSMLELVIRDFYEIQGYDEGSIAAPVGELLGTISATAEVERVELSCTLDRTRAHMICKGSKRKSKILKGLGCPLLNRGTGR